jgi:hypothetical protein
MSRTEINTRMMELTASLADYDVALDPDFDGDMEELDRQFAELRLTLDCE